MIVQLIEKVYVAYILLDPQSTNEDKSTIQKQDTFFNLIMNVIVGLFIYSSFAALMKLVENNPKLEVDRC